VTRIAVVVDRLHDAQVQEIRGMGSVLHAAGVAFLVVVSHDLPAGREMIRRLVQTGRLHGVIVTPMRESVRGAYRTQQVADAAEGVPRVTVGVRLPGIPVVLSDNTQGVRSAMRHLLDEGGRSRPMMVAGDPHHDDSGERESAYREMAAERGLELPRMPVIYGYFEREDSYRGIIDVLREGRDFDAVIAANDDMAVGVLDALHEQKIRVPQDVAVIGVDNTEESYRTEPSLSSIDVELEKQGAAAADLLLAWLRGEPVPDETRPRARLVVRRSSAAGSSTDPVEQALSALLTAASPASEANPPAPDVEAVLGVLLASATGLEADLAGRLEIAWRQWLSSVVGGTFGSEATASAATAILETVGRHPDPIWWRALTLTLQAALAGQSPAGRPAAALQAAVLRMVLQIETTLATARERRDREQLVVSQHVLELNQGLSSCDSVASLVREIGAYLPRLNVRRCFLVLLERGRTRGALAEPETAAGESSRARVAMCYRDGVLTTDGQGEPFAIDDLLPPSLASELEHGTLTLQSLFTEERWFGIVLHEQSAVDPHTAEALRLDASRVLDTIARAEELTERADELETLVGLRTQQLELEVRTRRAAEENLYEANVSLRQALRVDGLTGLQNRPSFDDHLDQIWQQHVRTPGLLSVLMIDVDCFKLYNDTYGHLAGDTCLRRVAGCLSQAVPRKQDIIARYGGEEFAIILPGTGAAGAELVAQRVLETLRAESLTHATTSHPSGRVSVSIGIASTEAGDPDSPEALLDLADKALYTAKRNGRDQAVTYADVSSGPGR
jgi:diguanylate cyclase (GGDEF)-like protein